MGNIDRKLLLAENYSPSTVASTVQTNPATTKHFMIDTGESRAAGAEMRGPYCDPMRLVVMLQEAAKGGANSTLTLRLFATDDPASEALDEDVISKTVTVGTAGIEPSKLVDIPVPQFSKRYLKLRVTVGGSAMTAGKITAWLSEGGE